MRITFKNGRFIARDSYEHHTQLKDRGWQYDGGSKVWYRDGSNLASAYFAVRQFRHFMDASARAEAERIEHVAQEMITASHALSADIDIPAPEGKSYLPFQRAGINYALKNPDVILGDEMGLGKTIQTIGVANADPEVTSVLVICPASLKLNWLREFEQWGTRGWTIAVAGNKKYDRFIDSAHVVIINYDLLSRYRERLTAWEWGMVVFDEAHYLKNKRTQRSSIVFGCNERQAIARLARQEFPGAEGSFISWDYKISHIQARLRDEPGLADELLALIKPGLIGRRRIFITGTPIPNRPVELFPILQQTDPLGLGKNYTEYVTRYCAGHQDGWGRWQVKGASNLDELQEGLRATCLVRRLKKDVLGDLPDKFYQLVEIEAKGNLGKLVRQEEEADKRNRKTVEVIRQELSEYGKDHSSQRYRETVNRLREAEGAMFSEMARIRRELAVAKVPSVIEHIHAIFDDGAEKLVVMGHHREVISALKIEFPEAAVIHGEVNSNQRQVEVDRFQNDPACRLFIGSIAAAGVGITLTAASIILFAEQDWSPGVMKQAEDRCHRIGQKESVVVQTLVVDGSLDATMAKNLSRKEAVIECALDAAPEQYRQIEPGSREKRATTWGVEKAETISSPSFAPGQVEAIHRCLKLLAAADEDRASEVNARGFSKFDGDRGHFLAERLELTPEEAGEGLHIITKYKRQLPPELYQAALGLETAQSLSDQSIMEPPPKASEMKVVTESPTQDTGKQEIPREREPKRKRGRPRRDETQPLPTATQRVKRSIDALVEAGGKRLMLRLTPEGYNALKAIMTAEGIDTETSAINRSLVERAHQLLGMPTK